MTFFIRYLGAVAYDAIIVTVLCFALTAFFLLFNDGQAIPPDTFWYQLSLISIGMAYYYCSIQYGGQTIGMRAWRFKLISVEDDRPSAKQIAARYFGFLPTLLISPFFLKLNYTLLNKWTNTEFIQLT